MKNNEFLSPSQLAWRRYKKNIAGMISLVFIILCALTAVFAYFIIPDNTPDANTQILEISTQKPGFEVDILNQVPTSLRTATNSMWATMAIISAPWNTMTVLSVASSKPMQPLTMIICTSISLAVHILANCWRRGQIQQHRLNGASLTKRVVSFLFFHTVIPRENSLTKHLPIHACLKTSAAWWNSGLGQRHPHRILSSQFRGWKPQLSLTLPILV